MLRNQLYLLCYVVTDPVAIDTLSQHYFQCFLMYILRSLSNFLTTIRFDDSFSVSLFVGERALFYGLTLFPQKESAACERTSSTLALRQRENSKTSRENSFGSTLFNKNRAQPSYTILNSLRDYSGCFLRLLRCCGECCRR